VPIIRIETVIRAPVERCFDLARDPDLHARSVAHTGERVVSRTGSGLLRALAARLFLTRYLRRLLTGRAAYLKQHAEREYADQSRSDIAR